MKTIKTIITLTETVEDDHPGVPELEGDPRGYCVSVMGELANFIRPEVGVDVKVEIEGGGE